MTHPRTQLPFVACSAAALVLSSCVVKDGSLDFTWWKDAAAPVIEDDIIIENGSGYYNAAPAPERIPLASIPRETEEEKPAPAAEETKPVPQPQQTVAQRQPAQTEPAGTPTTYVVRPGDTLSAIARRHGTTVRALVTANGMANANVPLQINKLLVIPRPGTTPAAPAVSKPTPTAPIPQPKPRGDAPAASTPGVHIVKPGDTIYRISRQYGVNPTALMQANGLTLETANTIRVGATLRIPAAKR